jgi:hypothetical protein
MTEEEQYQRLAAQADMRAQRRFRKGLDSSLQDGKWQPDKVALYMEAETLVERLRMGPCVVGCPYPAGGEHDHREYVGPWS